MRIGSLGATSHGNIPDEELRMIRGSPSSWRVCLFLLSVREGNMKV